MSLLTAQLIKKLKILKKNKQTMVFSETAQPSFSYYDLVTVCSLSQWTTFTENINWASNWPGPKDSLGRGYPV